MIARSGDQALGRLAALKNRMALRRFGQCNFQAPVCSGCALHAGVFA
jgi:hypothetical protein